MSRLFIAAVTCLSLAGGVALAQTTSTMDNNMGNSTGSSMSHDTNSMSHDTMGKGTTKKDNMGHDTMGHDSSSSMSHGTNQ